MFSLRQVLVAVVKAIRGKRERAAYPPSGASRERSGQFLGALTRTAEGICSESTLTADLGLLARHEHTVAVWTVVNEVVATASSANLMNTIDLRENRYFVDLTFFFLLLPAVISELEAGGVRVEQVRIPSYHLPLYTALLGDEETAIQTIGAALNLAHALAENADKDPALKRYLEMLSHEVRAFAWSGNKRVLDSFTALYLTFLREVIPGMFAGAATATSDSAN